MVAAPRGSASLVYKTTTEYHIETRKLTQGTDTGLIEDPKQFWIVIFGG